MKASQMIIIGAICHLLVGSTQADPGCVIRLSEDGSCESNIRITSSLDTEINGCADLGSNFSEISGLYCRSQNPCFKDYRSSYQSGSENISWYNCYMGAEVIPPMSGAQIIAERQSEGCVVKDVPDLNCSTGHRLYSQLDSRLTACADNVSENAEIHGAFCKSRLKCYKDFRSVYRDNQTTYAWYNCQLGASPIYGP